MDNPGLPFTERVKVINIREQGSFETFTEAISEYPLKIFLNDSYYTTINCTPQYLKELVVGNLFSQGYFVHYSQIFMFDLEPENQRAEIVVDMEKIIKLPIQLFKPAQVSLDTLRKIADSVGKTTAFKNTSGIKLAGIYKAGKETFKAEDFSALNATDKVIGYCLMRGIELKDKIFFLNDRITSETLSKVIRAGITVVLSQTTPTDLTINMAEESGIALIGFAGEDINIFANPQKTDLF